MGLVSLRGNLHRSWLKENEGLGRELNLDGCQSYGPFLGTLNIGCHSIIAIQKSAHNFDNHPRERRSWACTRSVTRDLGRSALAVRKG